MISFIDWLHAFIAGYPLFQYVVIFLGAALGGEFALFVLSFLAAQGVFPIYILIIFSFLGTFSSDLLWFLLGKTSLARKIISHRYATATISVITEAMDRFSRGNNFIAFVMAKFLIGTRIVLIVYLSKSSMELKRFIKYDVLAVLMWLIVVIPIGLVSGFGFTYLAAVFHNIYVAIGLILLMILVIIMIQIWFEKMFAKRSNIEIK